jgi:hypothetical protein
MQSEGDDRSAEASRKLNLVVYAVLLERGVSLSPPYWQVIEERLIRPAVPRILEESPPKSMKEAERNLRRVVSKLVSGEYPLETFEQRDASAAVASILGGLCPGFWPFC